MTFSSPRHKITALAFAVGIIGGIGYALTQWIWGW